MQYICSGSAKALQRHCNCFAAALQKVCSNFAAVVCTILQHSFRAWQFKVINILFTAIFSARANALKMPSIL